MRQQDNHLNLNMHVRRPYEREGFRETWNGLGEDVPDSWDREVTTDGWLWPHLYRMFNYHEPKHGGYDPSKGIDNDYAAVFVRGFDENGVEMGTPLVSATWHKVGGNANVSHVAGSERFVLDPGDCRKGKYKVWFVFADTWGEAFIPNAPMESAGGTIAYFEIEFERKANLQFTVKQPGLPAPPTGFGWDEWNGNSNT